MNAVRVRKVNHAMRVFDYSIDRLLDIIDERSRKGENDDAMNNYDIDPETGDKIWKDV